MLGELRKRFVVVQLRQRVVQIVQQGVARFAQTQMVRRLTTRPSGAGPVEAVVTRMDTPEIAVLIGHRAVLVPQSLLSFAFVYDT